MPETTTTTTTTTTKPKLTDTDQDQLIQDFITETKELIATVKKDAALLPELARLSFNEAMLTTGEDLVLTLQNSFTQRRLAMGAVESKNASLTAADAVVTKRNTDYRSVVRLAFSDAASRNTLGITGRLPDDRQKRITHLRTSFAAAATAPYAAELARYSYDAAELAKANQELDALDEAVSERDAAKQLALTATKTRNADYKALRAWRTRFNEAIKRARTRLASPRR